MWIFWLDSTLAVINWSVSGLRSQPFSALALSLKMPACFRFGPTINVGLEPLNQQGFVGALIGLPDTFTCRRTVLRSRLR